jgi:hypothetical protein
MGDAVNLGWKLAQVVRGISPEGLLDTYQQERHPAVARSLNYTMALNALMKVDPRTEALRDTVGELAAMEEPRKHLGALASGLGVHYDLGAGHPLLGRRVPDLDILTTDGPTTIFALMHEARPLLLNLGGPDAFDLDEWTDRVRVIDARCEAPWDLPAIGEVDSPTALLIRPDGHVAWVGEHHDPDLTSALTTWFGAPARTTAGAGSGPRQQLKFPPPDDPSVIVASLDLSPYFRARSPGLTPRPALSNSRSSVASSASCPSATAA